MEKKLLLIVLPALMALSGCSKVADQPELKNDVALQEVVEDNLAHDELFGESQIFKGPSIKKMGELDNKANYKIGYQIHFDEGEVVDADPDADDKLSIRFVAAIKDSYSSMVWSRGLTSGSGTEAIEFTNTKKSDGTTPLASTVVYTSLSNNGSDVMVAGGEDPENPYKDYVGFIVYSLTNIPYEDYLNHYLGVSLTMDAVQTDFYAVKIELNNEETASVSSFTIPNGQTGFFLAGRIDGQNKALHEETGYGKPRNGKVASFLSYFVPDDYFVVAQKTSSIFKIWDSTCLTDSDATVANDGFGRFGILDSYRYSFFLDDSNHITHTTHNTYYSLDDGYDYYLRGPATTGSWDSIADDAARDDYRLFIDGDNVGFLRVNIGLGEFKLTHRANWDDPKGWDNRVQTDSGAIYDGHITNSGGNFNCVTPGVYDVYLNNSWQVHFVLILAD